jgi:prepilin-type N-terminal cleavage/methylation domain-containing protein
MNNNVNSKEAFTLIEVMVAVMIVSVVILALIQMYANNIHVFLSLQKQTKTNQYSSFIIGSEQFGLENKSTSLDELVRDFDLHDDLRQKLKEIKVELLYTELDTIDLSESNSEDTSSDTQSASTIVLEVGRSILKTENASSSLLRLKIQ